MAVASVPLQTHYLQHPAFSWDFPYITLLLSVATDSQKHMVWPGGNADLLQHKLILSDRFLFPYQNVEAFEESECYLDKRGGLVMGAGFLHPNVTVTDFSVAGQEPT